MSFFPYGSLLKVKEHIRLKDEPASLPVFYKVAHGAVRKRWKRLQEIPFWPFFLSSPCFTGWAHMVASSPMGRDFMILFIARGARSLYAEAENYWKILSRALIFFKKSLLRWVWQSKQQVYFCKLSKTTRMHFGVLFFLLCWIFTLFFQDLFIRPLRTDYPIENLGPTTFTLAGRKFQREDLQVRHDQMHIERYF